MGVNWANAAHGQFMQGFMDGMYPEEALTKEECMANGMTEKEYDVQVALGSVPTTRRGMFDNVINDACAKFLGKK